jgi:hypothetical protein
MRKKDEEKIAPQPEIEKEITVGSEISEDSVKDPEQAQKRNRKNRVRITRSRKRS